jgi:hypothetical protein
MLEELDGQCGRGSLATFAKVGHRMGAQFIISMLQKTC